MDSYKGYICLTLNILNLWSRMYNEDYIITKVKLAFKLREHSQIFCINERVKLTE